MYVSCYHRTVPHHPTPTLTNLISPHHPTLNLT